MEMNGPTLAGWLVAPEDSVQQLVDEQWWTLQLATLLNWQVIFLNSCGSLPAEGCSRPIGPGEWPWFGGSSSGWPSRIRSRLPMGQQLANVRDRADRCGDRGGDDGWLLAMMALVVAVVLVLVLVLVLMLMLMMMMMMMMMMMISYCNYLVEFPDRSIYRFCRPVCGRLYHVQYPISIPIPGLPHNPTKSLQAERGWLNMDGWKWCFVGTSWWKSNKFWNTMEHQTSFEGSKICNPKVGWFFLNVTLNMFKLLWHIQQLFCASSCRISGWWSVVLLLALPRTHAWN